VFAAAELLAAGYYYLQPFRVTPSARLPVAVEKTTTAARSAPASKLASPSPAAVSSVPTSETDQLVQQAVALREQGDMTNALARLNQAAERDPKNAKVLEESAKTYEGMQLFDRSNETWRKIQDLGPSAGAAYELAITRLKTGAPTANPGTESTTTGGQLFTISDIKVTEEPDPDAETNVTLRISVKKQPEAVIDHTKVKIQVFFYDTVNAKDIKLTDADVNYEWLTRNHDWATNEPEVLKVNYLRPKNKVTSSDAALAAAAASVNPGRKGKPATPAPPTDSDRRQYLGYIIRVYYHDELQAVGADPPRLSKIFPPSSPGSQ
jgi:tetratricopeptide (TPR) repeat protein